ncbi:MAG: SusD/RagB family nutrient-binding outer membrane lipoprotein [Bacteroidia bacterium]|nr:SusD/RagB family nutrient-binding outer membrane lipoprotein [Bacteroidia bacterium]
MKKLIYSTLILGMAVFIVTGCKKLEDFGNTNVNPATTKNPVTSALLTNVLSGIGEYFDLYNLNSSWANLYCQYISETYYTLASCYAVNSFSPMYNYSGDLYDLQNIIILNTNDDTKANAALYGTNNNQIAIARILKAYIYWTITDRWGDVPYKDALKGDPIVNYDTQESIYKDLLKELTEAIAQFTTGTPVQGDIVFNGDISKWKKFANSLRMLMSLRLSKQYPLSTDYAAIQFKAALEDAGGSISTNDDNFQLNYPGGQFRNPYYNTYDGRTDFGESSTMTTLLGSLSNDQRQTVFGSTATGMPSTLGVPYGRNQEFIVSWCQENPTYSYVFHPDYRKQTDPTYVITASQVLLARAEAADRGWTSETSNTTTLYQAGISQSFLQWGLAVPDVSYLNSINVALPAAAGTGTNLEQIATQQYLAFFPDGVQGWSNWRRTNYPVLSPAPDATNFPPIIPRRYMYGTEDYALTKAGVEATVARMPGGDKMDSRVWWDKEE